MNLDVVFLPRDLSPGDLAGRAVVVFDVLRATTTMAAALAVGVERIEVFPTTAAAASARAAAGSPGGGKLLLCGEEKTLRPPGFDLGNSPGAFHRPAHGGRVFFMSTTNGTRAVLATHGAAAVFVGAVVNAAAVAQALDATGLDVTLLCSGTGGEVAMEDLIGAGAVLDALAGRRPIREESDRTRVARRLFEAARHDLHAALADSQGGRNVLAAGLGDDIGFASRLNALDVVGAVDGWDGDRPVVRPWNATAPPRSSR